MKAATLEIRALTGAEIISIHAAREGGDQRKRINVINISANSTYESDHSPLFIFHYTVKKAALQAKTCLLCVFRFLSA